MRIYLLIVLLILPFSTVAEIFQWLDAEGQSHFSDKPQPGASLFQVDAGYSFYQVKKIYDGDTILLSNGQKIRFLGVNTPEVEGRNKSLQAGGNEAKQWLEAQLKNTTVRLEKDVEKKDKYGRTLAHVFTQDKLHINLELVKQGFASVNIYPPNLKYVAALVAAEQQAEYKHLGIWGYQEYKLKPVADIKGGLFKGWQRVTGKVKNIRHTRKSIYLNFSDNFSLRILKKSLSYFPPLDSYQGKFVEVNGWINRRKGKYSMFIRHNSAIKIIQ